MNTKVLEYFIAAAEEQNISRAAERCFISQPALSQHIKELEKQLEVPLFTRTGHSVALTDFGRVYLNNALAILRTEQQTLDKIKALRESLQSHLRIITTERMKSILEHSIFPELKSQHPSVTISLLTGTADTSISSLLQDTADVGILEAAEELPPELIGVCLVRQEYALAVPFGHPLASLPSVSLSDCQEESFILGSPWSDLDSSQQKIFVSCRFSPKILYRADKLRTIARLVGKGTGVSLLPAGLPEEAQFGYRSVPLNPSWKFDIVFAFSKAHPLNDCGKDLLTMLRKFLSPKRA